MNFSIVFRNAFDCMTMIDGSKILICHLEGWFLKYFFCKHKNTL